MIALLIAALFGLRLHLGALVVAPAAPPAPPAVTVPDTGRPEGAARRPRGHVTPARPAQGDTVGTVRAPAAGAGTDAPAPAPSSPAPAPGPDSPTCDPGQSPAVDGCAQGQLPDETNGRELW